ncbi:restriction endonuclease subunit S [Bacteroides fragilis]|uniref:restriction endonuclease subunit S n=1 Tax=Bacteroides fragilis TaxID=817 RepID=UPI002030EED6|nr:restriction endonuclease subunit S [Bacteroides fragilis]MCM0234391.1 restriction endonuclease subunit S [Bacteroides fragilis]
MADNKNNNERNVPPLRFPEFSGEWDSFKLVELGKFIGGGTPSSSNLSFWTGSIPWISSSDIKEDNINNISISRYITEEAIEKSATKYCPAPVILIVSRVGVGKVALSHTSLCTSQDFCNIIEIKCHPVFLSYNLLRTMKRKSREVQGTSIKGITSDELQKMRVFIPKNKDEQNKISNLLTLLDERIATQNKIIDKLQSLIKGLIDDIITSQCARFVAFETLYSKASEGGTPTTSNIEFYKNGNIPFIKIDDLSNKYLETNKDYITELGLKKSSAWLIPANSIIYSNGATIGAISINKYQICTKQGILGIVPNSNIDVEYLYYFMRSSYFQKEVERVVTEGTMKTAYLKDINHIKCPIPDLDRQKEISLLLSVLSLKEDVERQLLQKYQIHKQYLLSQMFI